MAITDASTFTAYLGTNATNWTASQISVAVNAALGIIAHRTHREFDAAEVREWIDGTGAKTIRPKRTPITKPYRLTTGRKQALRVTGSVTGCNEISVSVWNGSMLFIASDGASAGVQTLTLSGYATMAALETAIEALSTGTWTATVTTEGNPVDIRPVASQDATSPTEATFDLPDGSSPVTVDGSAMWCPNAIPQGKQNVYVHYYGGYSATEMPADLVDLAHRMAADLLNEIGRDRELQSESIAGDYSYVRRIVPAELASITGRYRAELAHWARTEVHG